MITNDHSEHTKPKPVAVNPFQQHIVSLAIEISQLLNCANYGGMLVGFEDFHEDIEKYVISIDPSNERAIKILLNKLKGAVCAKAKKGKDTGLMLVDMLWEGLKK